MQSDTVKAAAARSAGRETSGMPGLLAGAAAAVGAAVLLWAWALPAFEQPPAQSDTSIPALSEVAPDELDAASATLGASPSIVPRLRQEGLKCGPHLAVVVAARGLGHAPVSLRVKSGQWFSPVFIVPDTPVRIAVPFPSTYATGHGTLIFIKQGGDANLTLAPAWHLAGPDGVQTREVTWIPDRTCPAVGAP